MRKMLLALSLSLLMPAAAMADSDAASRADARLFRQECGDCHMAFQPWFLPPASWRRIMAGLDNHFGEDASLDTATRERIAAYLVAHAGRARVDPANPPLRITGLNWFRREHRGGEAAWLRKRRNVKSMADCQACHRGAARGYYEDD